MSRTAVDQLQVIARVARKQIKQSMVAAQLGRTVKVIDKKEPGTYLIPSTRPGMVSRLTGP